MENKQTNVRTYKMQNRRWAKHDLLKADSGAKGQMLGCWEGAAMQKRCLTCSASPPRHHFVIFTKKKQPPLSICAGSHERRQMHQISETDGSTLRSCAGATSIFTHGSMWWCSQSRQCFAKRAVNTSDGWINSFCLVFNLFYVFASWLLATWAAAGHQSDQRLGSTSLLIKESIENMFIKSWPGMTSVPKRRCAVHNSADFVHVYVRSLTNVEKWE